MRTLRYAALSIVLVAASLPAQAQDPEVYWGLLDVLSPEEEAGSFIAGTCRADCAIGAAAPYALPRGGVGPARVVPRYPIGVCSGFTNLDDLEGNFALVRSDCSIEGEVFGAREDRALGLILYNADAPPDDDTALRNVYFDSDVLLPYPAVFITRYRGERLLAAIEAGEEVTAFMRMNPAVVASEPGTVPEAALGLSIWPNPSTSPGIALELERPEVVRLAVYDVLGREVAVLHDGVLGAGPQRFEIASLPAGLYVVRAESASVQTVRRVTVLR